MIKDYIKENPGISVTAIILVIILVQSYDPFVFLTNILSLIDTYLKLILTSWPAVVLILGLILLSNEEKALYLKLKKWVSSLLESKTENK